MRANARGLAAVAALVIALAATGCAKKSVQAPPQPPPTPAQPGPTAAETTPTPPPTPPAPTPPAPSNTEVAAQLKPVFFALDSSTLSDDARAALDANAKLLRANEPVRITIEGHCDERGTVEYNQALGERRAGATRDYLVAAGIAASRLQVISYGKERPFADGHDEAAWAQNRRAQFVGQ